MANGFGIPIDEIGAEATDLLIPPVGGFGAQASPPQDEEEKKERKSAWRSFLDSAQTDPLTRLMLINVGAQLMQPVQPGQTSLGHLGQSVANSANMLFKLRAGQTAAQQKAAVAAEDIAQSRSTRKVREAKAPSEIELNKARAAAARRQGKSTKTQEVDRLAAALKRAAPESYSTDAEAIIAATQFIDRAKISPEKENMSALARILPNWSLMDSTDKSEILSLVSGLSQDLSAEINMPKKDDKTGVDKEAQELFNVYMRAQRRKPIKGSKIYNEILKRVHEKYPDFQPGK